MYASDGALATVRCIYADSVVEYFRIMDSESMDCVVASGPVIIEDGRVLLVRHGEDGEQWKFPGGRVEPADFSSDDALEAACRREAREELGVEIEVERPIKPMMIKYPGRTDTSVVLIHYLAKRMSEIKPGTDIIESGWFSLSGLPENCGPNIKPVIEAYRLQD